MILEAKRKLKYLFMLKKDVTYKKFRLGLLSSCPELTALAKEKVSFVFY